MTHNNQSSAKRTNKTSGTGRLARFASASILVAMVAMTAIAFAQPGSAAAPAAGSAAAVTPTAVAPPAAAGSAVVAPADAGSAAQPAAQPAAAGSAAPAAMGSAAPPVASGSAEKPQLAPAWYDDLAAKPWSTSTNFWMPESINKAAHGAHKMFYGILAMSIFFFVAIAAAVIWMTIRFRHRKGHTAKPSAAHNDTLEITWTVIPTIICVFLFVYGWRTYLDIATPPAQAVEIQVQAWQWGWEFTHTNGVKDENLHVPVNTDVRLVMTARDVLHSFFVPALSVKQDLVPRRYTYTWFHAEKPGIYRLNCTEYCGTSHSDMNKKLIVHEPGGYERYLADKFERDNNIEGAPLGAKVYKAQCSSCHSIDGGGGVGPTWKGMFGHEVELTDGSKVMVDENYVRDSIVAPQKQIVKGYGGNMPAFVGLKEKEIAGLIEFMKTLK